MSFRSSRRGFLQASSLGTGAALLSPLAGALSARAQGTAVKRIVFVVQGNGMNGPNAVTPPEHRKDRRMGTDGSLAGLFAEAANNTAITLPPMMTALQPFKNRVLLIDQLNGINVSGTNDSHTKSAMSMTCVQNGGGNAAGAPGGISIDQVLGQTLGAQSPFKTILLGAASNPAAKLVNHVSASGANQPVPAQCSAKEAFAKFFASAVPAPSGGTGAADEILSKKLVHDYMAEQIKSLNKRLGSTERASLDQMLSYVEDTQKRLMAPPTMSQAMSCSAPALDSAYSRIEDRLKAQFDVGASALVCGLTQVMVITSTPCHEHFSVVYPSISPKVLHDLAHEGDYPGTSWNAMDAIHNLHAAGIARMAAKLDSVQEGNGTMLDNTVFAWFSDNGRAHHSGGVGGDAILIGTAGGAIKANGRYLRYVGAGYNAPAYANWSGFFVSLLKALGAPAKFAGNDKINPDIVA